jgi:hypothetical protein
MIAIDKDDACERFREFMVYRTWLHGEGELLADEDYASLKARDGKFWESLSKNEVCYLIGFIDGWRRSR